jgi:hypothetical protein
MHGQKRLAAASRSENHPDEIVVAQRNGKLSLDVPLTDSVFQFPLL